MKIHFPSSIAYDHKIFIGFAIATTLAVFLLPHVQPYIIPCIPPNFSLMLLPGFTVIQLLFPEDELKPIERAALSVSISLALIPLIGLTLNSSL